MSSLADMAGLGKLLQENRARLLATVRRRLDPAISTRIDAEDILSEAFLLARRKWSASRQESKQTPYAWLYRIVMDCLIEAWRRETRAKRTPRREMPWPEESSVELGIGLVAAGSSPSEAAARAKLQRRMRKALEVLSENDRQILWMRHYDQLSFREAATVLEISENAATVRYVRALKRLRAIWQEMHGSPECEA